MGLEGRVALVTGSSHGIGRATARALAAAGADVAVNYFESRDAGESCASEVRALGRRAAVLRADVREEAEVERLFAETERALGPVDVLVANVGEFVVKPVAETTLAEWREMSRSNLESAFLCCRRAIPSMRKRRFGRIVTVTVAPVERLGGSKNTAAYAAAKAGVLVLTRTIALEEVKHGITANAVGPGMTDNGRVEPEFRDLMLRLAPIGRLATPDEVARAILFLADPASSYITGAHLPVGGGWGI